MTAEVVIMNKGAIAIAADSASTIGQKIYTTNKVFMLSKFCPVGIMIYGTGEIMSVPWEPIVKLFREGIMGEDPYNNLEDYANEFINYLNENTYLFPIEQQKDWFEKRVTSSFIKIRDSIKNKMDKYTFGDGTDEKEIEAITKKHRDGCINNKYKKLKHETNLLWKKLTHNDLVKITNFYFKNIEEIKNEIFKEISLDIKSTLKLRKIAALSFYNSGTGIVITGFGTKNLFPELVTYATCGLIDNKLIYKRIKQEKINFENPAAIIPFAQSDVIETFLNGIDPEFNDYFQKEVFPTIMESNERLVHHILNDLEEDSDEEKSCKKELRKRYKNTKTLTQPIYDRLKEKIMEMKVQLNRDPMIAAIQFLPKDELAVMAESLLTLTSLKRKYSIYSLESVGGDIDVAIISKSDGFVWIKRKNYFNKDLNHHFFHNYYHEK